LEHFVEAVTDYALYMLDAEGNVSNWNPGAERLKGYSADDIIGRHYSIFFTDEDRASGLPAHGLKIASQKGRYVVQGWRVRKDGSRFYAGVHLDAIRDDRGGLLGYVKVTRDIAAGERVEERIFQMVESAPNAMVMINASGGIEMVNVQAERMFGYARHELVGQPVEMLIPERFHADQPGLRSSFFTNPESRAMGVAPDLFARRKDGSEFAVDVALNPVETNEGAMVVSSIVDITTRKRMIEELERKNEELEAFTYSVSHDLRAPLRSIDGFSQALIEDCADKLDEQGKDYLRRIRAGAQRMGGLIDDLLQLSRIDRVQLRREPVDLSGLAHLVIAELRSSNHAHAVEVQVRDGLTVEADSHLLRIVLENLLGNASKFTSKTQDAKIQFGVDTLPEGPAYFVRDNGAGFEMAYAAKLFGVFQRLHGQEDFPGTGIGLVTVRRIIHRHGGRVWAEGLPGAGATFYFTL
jgi:PAS domain S-box-containing protein